MRKQQAIIFGASTGGKRAYKFYNFKYEIKLFFDNNSLLLGKKIYGKEIVSIANYQLKSSDMFVIASSRPYEIYDQLMDLGVQDSNIEFAHPDILSGRYDGVGATQFLVFGLFVLILFLIILWSCGDSIRPHQKKV